MFVTCLVDLFRPQVGFAAIQLLEKLNCHVIVPSSQTCCGQPAYNSGDRHHTKQIAAQVISLFKDYDYVVVPSGSCAGMIYKHYPLLFQDEPEMLTAAKHLSSRTFELVSFLVDVMKIKKVGAEFPATITFHDSCSSLRELQIKHQPRTLLSSIQGLTFKELPDSEVCCGFGGTFCVKYSAISNKMVSDKINCIRATGVDAVSASDLGCLLNIERKLAKEKSTIKVFHIAEILAGK